ncbi:hypothetical protein [Streptomyces hygroscopicus]|uniref:hypothetical protein n=1 Tax=Streptomyces hygroscopicus TaxID=1912 RepID=UPI0004CC111A|nr:hypothetical protein [Streptomyces hygroscopicus]
MGSVRRRVTAEWRFEADGDGTLVRNEESWSGDPVDADTENSRKLLGQSLDAWLEHLRRAAEDPA